MATIHLKISFFNHNSMHWNNQNRESYENWILKNQSTENFKIRLKGKGYYLKCCGFRWQMNGVKGLLFVQPKGVKIFSGSERERERERGGQQEEEWWQRCWVLTYNSEYPSKKQREISTNGPGFIFLHIWEFCTYRRQDFEKTYPTNFMHNFFILLNDKLY